MTDKLQGTTEGFPANSPAIARRSFQDQRAAIAKVILRRAVRSHSMARLACSASNGYRFDSLYRICVAQGGGVNPSCCRRARVPHSTRPVAVALAGSSAYSRYWPVDRLNTVLLPTDPMGVV